MDKKALLGWGYKGLYKSPTYNSWGGMKSRCDTPSTHEYELYGGRGITYDPRWKDFKNFVDDMGERPEGTTLDRIDVNKDYCKENCRWATKPQQQRNMRCHKREDVGVTWSPERNKWQAKFINNGKQYAKRFLLKEDAIAWRKEMERKFWNDNQEKHTRI